MERAQSVIYILLLKALSDYAVTKTCTKGIGNGAHSALYIYV